MAVERFKGSEVQRFSGGWSNSFKVNRFKGIQEVATAEFGDRCPGGT
jgi:hypothetical protein